jgi:hypothetical protein
MNELENKIRVKQLEIQVEQDPEQRQKLNKQLRLLQLKKEIEVIKKKIEQLG